MSDKQAERIQKLVENPNLNNWEKGFITSVNSYFQKHGRVSNKQWATIQKVEANYSPEVIAQRQAWKDSWGAEQQFRWQTALNYYSTGEGRGYFLSLISRYEDGGIPTEKEYRKLVDNKYVQNVIETIQSEPLYDVGSLVQVRRTAKGSFYRYRDCIALVVDNSGPVTSATKGAKTYSILPFGETAPVKIQERWLKKKRGSK